MYHRASIGSSDGQASAVRHETRHLRRDKAKLEAEIGAMQQQLAVVDHQLQSKPIHLQTCAKDIKAGELKGASI